MKKSLLAALFLLGCLSVQAVEFSLATITSDVDKDVTVFYLETDGEGLVHSLRYKTTAPNGQITKDESHTLEQVLDGGIVLDHRFGRDVVQLKLENFTAQKGGGIKLIYLVNALRGTYRELKLNLLKEDQAFKIFDLQGKVINTMFFYGNYIPIAGLVGIRDIKFGYQQALGAE